MVDSAAGQGILSISIKDKNALYLAYMPFVTNGGLFIPTHRVYEMGQEVFMLLNLMDEIERLPIAGKIIWVTPPSSEGFRTIGVGVQFSDQDNGASRNKIENYLAGSLESDKTTHTM
jgi:type IV pilus assembly protein PilZ